MQLGVIGDPHLGCTIYTDKRSPDFARQFNTAVAGLLERKVDGIAVLGDVFDSSAYRRNIDTFASRLSEVAGSFLKLKEAGIPLYAIAGNHEYGRGRTAGELRILHDLGVLTFLESGEAPFGDCRIVGISWKAERGSLLEALARCGPPAGDAILLLHQFCAGSRCVPATIAEVGGSDLEGWAAVFCGHHHQYEDLGYAVAPGSLEVRTAGEIGQKGYCIYDTEAGTHEFVALPPGRAIRSAEMDASGLSADQFREQLAAWIGENAAPGAVLILRLRGSLARGRASEIRLGALRTLGLQKGCLKVRFAGGLEDPVRTAAEIRSSASLPEFLERRFGPRAALAGKRIESLRERGDSFASDFLAELLGQAGDG
ncbi:MAG: metallophosphoesterase [Methanomicrobiales archaeon]|nr:metallophosphoesterase [Methanomicrobiales archaeon]MDI6875863.1 metallophosphoesterase [Methanomicrobiales archaeon]